MSEDLLENVLEALVPNNWVYPTKVEWPRSWMYVKDDRGCNILAANINGYIIRISPSQDNMDVIDADSLSRLRKSQDVINILDGDSIPRLRKSITGRVKGWYRRRYVGFTLHTVVFAALMFWAMLGFKNLFAEGMISELWLYTSVALCLCVFLWLVYFFKDT